MSSIGNVFESRELLWNLTLRELRTKYRRSFLGWAWSMLNPLASVAIYSFVFSVLFKSTAEPGDPSGLTGFAFFLLAALLPWNFFSLVNSMGMGSVVANSGLVRRVAFPLEILVLSNVLHACVQFSIEMGIFISILLLIGAPVVQFLPIVLMLSFLLALFGCGFGLALSAICVYFKDMNYLWGILLQVWFFMTPVVYAPTLLDGRAPEWLRKVLILNPMHAFVTAYRDTLYHGRMPSASRLILLLVASLTTLTLGWLIFKRMSRRLAEEV